jgi:hypothetical protein
VEHIGGLAQNLGYLTQKICHTLSFTVDKII